MMNTQHHALGDMKRLSVPVENEQSISHTDNS